MEPISLATVAAFLGACLYKAGEKISEKTIETIFNNKKDIANNFTELFRDEIITLGLSDAATPAEIQQQLEANREVATQALEKLKNNPTLLEDLNENLQKENNGMTIHAEKIGQVVEEMRGNITQTFNF